MTAQLRLPVGTVEYVRADVTCDVTLSAQVVTISIDSGATWLPAEWTGSAGTTRRARTSSAVTFSTAGSRKKVLVKITDSPEIPIVEAGTIGVYQP